jgi:sugar phosphate isomerase/epimerase
MDAFGIQLYSVRDALERDAPGTLRALRDAGYAFVELYGVDPDDAVRWRGMLSDAGLKAVAAHVDYDLVVNETQAVVAMARAIGYEDIIVPWLTFDSIDEWTRAARTLDEIGEALRDEDLRLGYHNHDHEFAPIGGTRPFDLIFDTARPENLFLELDVRWASAHANDPIATMKRFGERCRFLHLKEEPQSHDPEESALLGEGTVDWTSIVQTARSIGVRAYIVEQDNAPDPLEAARRNATFVQKL